MRKAGLVVAEMHEKTRAAIRPGITTMDLNKVAAEVIERRGATSNFLGYHGFPAVICTSPNDMIVHGSPSDTVVLKEGDIISVDCGAIIEGYHGDAAYTSGVGHIDAESQRLLDVTERSLFAGIEVARRIAPARPTAGCYVCAAGRWWGSARGSGACAVEQRS